MARLLNDSTGLKAQRINRPMAQQLDGGMLDS
jgi:hypothetical protein